MWKAYLYFLCGTIILCSATSVSSQQPDPTPNPWESRAQNLTEALVADGAQLSKPDKALLWARLGQVWSNHDPQRARKWFTLAVETIEAPTSDKSEAVCRTAVARILFGLIASRDRALAERLIAIIDVRKPPEDDKERLETANALTAAGLEILDRDPKTATVFAEESLKIGISLHLGAILWRLQKKDPNAGEKLFLQILEIAKPKPDTMLLNMLSISVLSGPFSSDRYKGALIGAMADVIAKHDEARNNEPPVFCDPIPLLPPLLADFERLRPEFSQRVRTLILRCQQLRNEDGKSTPNNAEVKTPPRTVEEYLKAASESRNQYDRVEHLINGAHMAAQNKDFDRAINILDSMENADRESLGDAWESWRWDFAAGSACKHRQNENFQGVNKVIDDSPPKLRGFVRISFAIACEATISQSERTDVLESARKDLERTEPAEQSLWYLSLVRVYAKYSLDTAPEVLSQAIAAINRSPKDQKDKCPSSFNPTVLSHQLMFDRYKLPAALLDADEAGVFNNVRSVQTADVRAALRLQLLAASLEKLTFTREKALPQ